MSDLTLRPITRKDARAFVAALHRHHPKSPPGDLFRVACVDQEGRVRGVAIAGRPVARHLCDGVTMEVTRCCTDGAPNACSLLYGALARAARALGYRRGLTYILESEDGASLRAVGWRRAWRTRTRPDGWLSRPGRELPSLMEQKIAYTWGEWEDDHD